MIKLKDILNESPGNYKDGSKLRGSQWLFDFIKQEEGDPKKKGEPVLTAYKYKNDPWTIGYGHTGNVTSGMKITKQQALQFMYKDLTEAANCVRRLFTRWDKEQGLDIPITQEMFDSIVSLVFNTGCGAMLDSDFIQSVKRKRYQQAAKEILTYRLKSGFSGLIDRRKKESQRFLTNL
jgi:lysozyme